MFEFLEQYTKRMKNVGSHAFIHKNSLQKTTWKNYGFIEWYEQINVIFLLLLYIMEQSLKEEPCTIDDMGGFLDDLNRRYFKKEISYEESKALADFIVNTILCNDGCVMYFNGFNFSKEQYEPIHISYIGNKIVFLEGEVRRTSYFLTTEGYNFVLSTLELENHLKLTIQEMIFKLHLEKANYSQAVEDVKGIFNQLRIKLQEIQEAMTRIRQNALNYSVEDYKRLQEETLGTLEDTKKKYEGYKQVVKATILQLEEEHINVKQLDEKQKQNLTHLQIIEGYLSRAIEEQQRILGVHFDLKSLYEKELEGISAMTLIKRFSLSHEVYEPLLKDVNMLLYMEDFLRPLFNQEVDKSYNLNLAFLEQKPLRKKRAEEEETFISFEDDDYEADYRLNTRDCEEKQKQLIQVIHKMQRQEAFEDEFFKAPLLTLEKIADHPDFVIENLNNTLAAYATLMIKLEADIALIEKEKQSLLDSMMQYIYEIHEHMGKIDRNSTVTIHEKPIKMLKIDLPNWEEQENLYEMRLKDFVKSITNEAIGKLEQNEMIDELLGKRMTTKNLYNEVVGISQVGVKLYKVEEEKVYQISWDEVAKNSGGEGFLSAFVVLSSLLSYMRRDENDLWGDYESGKVLVMDNPFAQTNAAHLLKPLMDMANKRNTQLICLSGLNGESIYNRFENIYVLNLIASKLHEGTKYLRSDHLRGPEAPQELVGVQIQTEVIDQMTLF